MQAVGVPTSATHRCNFCGKFWFKAPADPYSCDYCGSSFSLISAGKPAVPVVPTPPPEKMWPGYIPELLGRVEIIEVHLREALSRITDLEAQVVCHHYWEPLGEARHKCVHCHLERDDEHPVPLAPEHPEKSPIKDVDHPFMCDKCGFYFAELPCADTYDGVGYLFCSLECKDGWKAHKGI